MSIPVTRIKRNQIMGDPASAELYYLTRSPGHSRIYTIEDVAEETETTGGMSAEDVAHVMSSFVRSLRKILVQGDKVKIDKLGTFYITFNSEGTVEEEECTIKNIRKINVRFAVANSLRLVNDSTATTRGAANNVKFHIKSDAVTAGGSSGSGNGSGEEPPYIDPDA